MGKMFNAADVVNKTLIAKRKVYVYSTDNENEQYRIGYVNAGHSVGVVYSYLSPGLFRSKLWWQFYDNGRYYYVPHGENIFDTSALQQQGVLTLEEKRQQEKQGFFAGLLASIFPLTAVKSGVLLSLGVLFFCVYLFVKIVIRKK